MIVSAERYTPGMAGEGAVEHLHRYLIARRLAQGKVVLDVACGEGYGSNILAEVALSVTGIDLAADVIEQAVRRYRRENLHFVCADCCDLPVPDCSVDLIVSFETIEHHDRHQAMLDEFKRVLKPDGMLLMSSPNRPEFNRGRSEPYPFHVHELDYSEFHDLLSQRFSNVEFLRQNFYCGSLITRFTADSRLSVLLPSGLEEARDPALFYVALASDAPLPQLPDSLLEESTLADLIPDAPEITEVRLYWHDAMGGFDQSRSVGSSYALDGKPEVFSWTLNVNGLRGLRLDPASGPSVVVIHRIELVERQDGQSDRISLWRWDGDLSVFVDAGDCFLRSVAAGAQVISWSNDPRFELAIPPEVLAKVGAGSVLTVELTAYPLLDALPEVLQEAARAPVPAVEARGAGLPATLPQKLAETAALFKQVVERRNATIEALRAENTALNERQQALEARVLRAEAQLEVLREFTLVAFGKGIERI